MSHQDKTPPKPKQDAELEQEPGGELSEEALETVTGGALRSGGELGPIVRSSDPQEGGELA